MRRPAGHSHTASRLQAAGVPAGHISRSVVPAGHAADVPAGHHVVPVSVLCLRAALRVPAGHHTVLIRFQVYKYIYSRG